MANISHRKARSEGWPAFARGFRPEMEAIWASPHFPSKEGDLAKMAHRSVGKY